MMNPKSDLSVLTRSGTGLGSTSVPVPKPRWKSRVLLPCAILASFGALMGYSLRDRFWPASDVLVIPVVVKASSQTGGGVSFQAPGWVEADPYLIAVSALTPGVVSEVRALEGDVVKPGQVVARLVDDDAKLALERSEAEIKVRNAEYEVAKATLRAAQRDWDHPIERTRAVSIAENKWAEAKADLKKLTADINVEAARADELKDKLQREQSAGKEAVAELQIERTRLQLKTQVAITESVRAKQPIVEARIRQLDADRKAARENLALRIEEHKHLEEAKAMIARAEAALKRAEIERAEAQLKLKRMDVVSPVGGIVMQRLINPGDKLMLNMDAMHSAHAMHLYDPKKLQVRVDVPLADAAKTSVGQEAEIVVEVLPDKTFKGRVTRVVHEADIQKNTLQVKVAIQDPVLDLKPEMLARVKFLAPVKKVEGKLLQRVFVPERLVAGAKAGKEGSAKVWLVDRGNSTAIQRTITLGNIRMDGWAEVLEGLQQGDQLIASDTRGFKEGQKIKVTGEARE